VVEADARHYRTLNGHVAEGAERMSAQIIPLIEKEEDGWENPSRVSPE